jgi:nucleotide-binding universal stress UspA family protein
VRHGLVAEEIVAESHSGDYQLVVIGTQCGDHWRHTLLDDLAHQIIARADCPVLVACPGRG